MGLATNPAKAGEPPLQAILDAIATLQTSVDTLQSTLNNMPTAWYQVLHFDKRFLLVMGNEAVLDRETGLVWEKEPSKDPSWWLDAEKHASWFGAFNHCHSLSIGGRRGWRLPMIHEFASLMDTTENIPALPADHPFVGFDWRYPYWWSAYTDAYNSSNAWAASFDTYGYVFYVDKQSRYNVWCVRGGQGIDPQ